MVVVHHLEFAVTSWYCIKGYIFIVATLCQIFIGFLVFEIRAITSCTLVQHRVNGDHTFLWEIQNPLTD